MILQEYIDQVRRVLDEYGTDISFWSDEELTVWLNEALKEVAKKTHYLTDRVYIEPTDESEYPLPDKFIDWYKLKTTEGFMETIDIEEDGEEKGFYIWGDTIFLSQIDTDEKITLYYYKVPNLMKTTLDESNLPIQYEDIIIPFCLYRAFLKDRKEAEAQLNQQEFFQRVELMKKRYNNEPSKAHWKVIR